MSSELETLAWREQFDLSVYDWDEWVKELGKAVRWPVYDISKILDASAAYDICCCARHFPADRAHELTACKDVTQYVHVLRAAGLDTQVQWCYAISALYKHCSKYTTGMSGHRVRHPPTDHMDDIPLLPDNLFCVADTLFGSPENTAHVLAWIRRAVFNDTCRPTTFSAKSRRCMSATLRHATEHADDYEMLRNRMSQFFHDVRQTSPKHVPYMSCTVVPAPPAMLSISLYVQRPSPSYE